MLKDTYPYYLANEARHTNTDLAVTDKYTGEIAFRVALANSAAIDARIAASGKDFSDQAVRRDEYLARVDGIAFGEDPRQGYFRDSLFLHPEMKFQLRFPDGWKTVNQRDAVIGMSQEGDAVIQLTLADEAPPSAAHGTFFGQEGLSRRDWPLKMAAGLPTVASAFQRMSERMRHSIAGSPGVCSSRESGIVLT